MSAGADDHRLKAVARGSLRSVLKHAGTHMTKLFPIRLTCQQPIPGRCSASGCVRRTSGWPAPLPSVAHQASVPRHIPEPSSPRSDTPCQRASATPRAEQPSSTIRPPTHLRASARPGAEQPTRTPARRRTHASVLQHASRKASCHHLQVVDTGFHPPHRQARFSALGQRASANASHSPEEAASSARACGAFQALA